MAGLSDLRTNPNRLRMKAIVIHQTGRHGRLKLQEVPEPTCHEDELIIKVAVAGVNPVDTKIRAGKFARFHPCLPAVLGRDISGTVMSVGSKVVAFTEGDSVFGMLDYDRGTYAEFATASVREIAPKPVALGHDSAAAIPVAGQTAWQALFEFGKLRPGQRVLIHGASGGVGHLAVQLASWCGARVSATCKTEDVTFVQALGAEQVIDYKTHRFEDELSELDLILDLVGGETRERSWATLKAGGVLVSTLPAPVPAGRSDVSGREMVVYSNPGLLTRIAKLMVGGQLKVEIDRAFSLAEAAAAHRHLEEDHPRGKTVLIVQDSEGNLSNK
jgi:NADPH:quinone reductase-like Zn-dependent oxidoreductase